MHPNTRAAITAGHRRWLAEMRLAKAAGKIKKFPCGRPPRGTTLNPDKRIRKAQRIVARLIEETEMAKRQILGIVEDHDPRADLIEAPIEAVTPAPEPEGVAIDSPSRMRAIRRKRTPRSCSRS